jgi:hypothetical protein
VRGNGKALGRAKQQISSGRAKHVAAAAHSTPVSRGRHRGVEAAKARGKPAKAQGHRPATPPRAKKQPKATPKPAETPAGKPADGSQGGGNGGGNGNGKKTATP